MGRNNTLDEPSGQSGPVGPRSSRRPQSQRSRRARGRPNGPLRSRMQDWAPAALRHLRSAFGAQH
eukprot:13332027-Alexandrium_andersonii.AAC.1